MTEKNDLGGGVSLTDILSLGEIKIGAKGEFNRARRNERNFLFTDTFIGLVDDLTPEYCRHQARIGNAVYPVSGAIGMKEVIKTYIDLNQLGYLRAKDAKPLASQMSETLTFTTFLTSTLGGGPTVDGVLKLNPVGSGFSVTTAGLGMVNSRSDIHRVTISLALGDETSDAKEAKPPKKTEAKPRRQPGGSRLSRTPAENRAVDFLKEQESRKLTNTLNEIVRRQDLR
jgi:hypothetical protein